MVSDKWVGFAVLALPCAAGLLFLVEIGVEFARSLRRRCRSGCQFCAGMFAVVVAYEALLAAVLVILLR